MRNTIITHAAPRLFGLVAMLGIAAMPAYAEVKAPEKSAYEQCLERLGCPRNTGSTCALHCSVNPTLGDGPYGSRSTIIGRPGGAVAPGKAAPLQKLQNAPAQ